MGKGLPHGGVARPKVSRTASTVTTASGIEVGARSGKGANELLIVTIKGHNRVDFGNYCANRGLGKHLVENFGGRKLTYEVWGSVQSLASLCHCDFVTDAHYAMNVRVGGTAAGGGPEKVKSQPAKPRKGKPSGFTVESWLDYRKHEACQVKVESLSNPARV